jgi:hypothetical protein
VGDGIVAGGRSMTADGDEGGGELQPITATTKVTIKGTRLGRGRRIRGR